MLNNVRFGSIYYFTPQKPEDKEALLKGKPAQALAAELMYMDDFAYRGGQAVAVNEETGEIIVNTRTVGNLLGYFQDVQVLLLLADKLKQMLSPDPTKNLQNDEMRKVINDRLLNFSKHQYFEYGPSGDHQKQQQSIYPKKEERSFTYSA